MSGMNEEECRPVGQVRIDGSLPPGQNLSVFSRPEVRDVCYSGQALDLAGHTYIACRFEQCTLDASSFDYDLIDCVVDAATVIHYGAPVANILQLFDAYYPWANRHLSAFFVPLQNVDGSMRVWFIGKEF